MRIVEHQRPWHQSAQQWADTNPVLLDGEHGYDTTNNNEKIGDGVTPWNSLKWAHPIYSTSTPPVAPAGSVWLKPAP